jgi:hypothetical protein
MFCGNSILHKAEIKIIITNEHAGATNHRNVGARAVAWGGVGPCGCPDPRNVGARAVAWSKVGPCGCPGHKEETPTQICQMRRSLLPVLRPLSGSYCQCLHPSNALVCIFFCVIANDGQLEVLALEAVDQQDDVAHQSYNANGPTNESHKQPYSRNAETPDHTKNNIDHRQAAKEQNRLHRVEAHEAILLLHKEEYETCHPGQNIAQASFNIRRHAH